MIAHALVADGTGCVDLSLWDTNAEWLQPGDIIRLRGGYSTIFKGQLILYGGRHGSVERVGEFTMGFVESPNMSKAQWVKDPNNPKEFIPAPPVSASEETTLAKSPTIQRNNNNSVL